MDIVSGQTRFGGAAAVMSINAASLGVDSYFLGPLGSDKYSKEFKKEFEKRDVKIMPYLQNSPCVPTCTINELHGLGSTRDWQGERTIKYIKEIGKLDVDFSKFDGVVFANAHRLLINALLGSVKSKNLFYIPGPQIVNNDSFFVKKLLGYTNVVFTNEEEFPVVDAHYPLKAEVDFVVETKAAQGGVVHSKDGDILFSALPVKAVDSTGAGDAFALGVTIKLLQGQNIKRAIEEGKKLARQVVEKYGGIL